MQSRPPHLPQPFGRPPERTVFPCPYPTHSIPLPLSLHQTAIPVFHRQALSCFQINKCFLTFILKLGFHVIKPTQSASKLGVTIKPQSKLRECLELLFRENTSNLNTVKPNESNSRFRRLSIRDIQNSYIFSIQTFFITFFFSCFYHAENLGN